MGPLFQYNPVTKAIIERLQSILGEDNVSADEEKRRAYSRDEVPAGTYDRDYTAEALVFPENTRHVSEVMKMAYANRIPVTPRGAGTGLSGGALPAYGGIVMSFEKMNRILELDEGNLSVTVEPGVVTAEINKLAESRGLLYAGDPCSGDASYIGGNIAENAGGNKVIKYGATGAQLLALEVVTADGAVMNFGGKRRKDVTGLDFVHLMAGSEGMLAIVTKAILKLVPLPKYTVDLLAAFPNAESAINFVPKIITEGRIMPASVEFMDKNSLQLVERYSGAPVPAGDAGAALIIQIEGNEYEQLERDYIRVGTLSQKHGAAEVFVADTRTTKERLWHVRKSIPEAAAALCRRYTKEDLVVPTALVPALLDMLKELCAANGLGLIAYGHAGDGNMHCTITGPDSDDWKEKLHKGQRDIYKRLHEMGGTLSGEHGIGFKRKGYIKYFLEEEQIELIKRVKLAFDPRNILNPGKLVEWQ